jgi:hypothetical protein
MSGMFDDATAFNQNLSSWTPNCKNNTDILTTPGNFATGSKLTTNQQPNWGASCP